VGIKHASGDFIQFLDHDDLLHPEKLRIQVRAAQTYDADLVVGRNRGFSSLNEIEEILVGSPPAGPGLHVPRPFFAQMRWSHLAWLVRRDLMLKVGFWNERPRLSDYEMDVRLKLAANRICLVNALLSFWRMSNPFSESKSPPEEILSWKYDVAIAVFRLLQRNCVLNRAECRYLFHYLLRTAWRFLKIGKPGRAAKTFLSASRIWFYGFLRAF